MLAAGHTVGGVVFITAMQLIQCIYMVCVFGGCRPSSDPVLTPTEHKFVGVKTGAHLVVASALTFVHGPCLYFTLNILVSLYLTLRVAQETEDDVEALVGEEGEEEELIMV